MKKELNSSSSDAKSTPEHSVVNQEEDQRGFYVLPSNPAYLNKSGNEEKLNPYFIDIYFYNPSSSRLDSQTLKIKIEKIKLLYSSQSQDLEIFSAEYDLAHYFLAHGKYEWALIVFYRLIILMDKFSWKFTQKSEPLIIFNIMSAVLNANIGHCYFQLEDYIQAYFPYFRCFTILSTCFPVRIHEIKYIISKSEFCLSMFFNEGIQDLKDAKEAAKHQFEEEKFYEQERFKKTLKGRKNTSDFIKQVLRTNIAFTFLSKLLTNFHKESSYIGIDNDFLKELLMAEFILLSHFDSSPTSTSDQIDECIEHIEKIFWNISPFDQQASNMFKICFYQIKLASLKLKKPQIKEKVDYFYNNLQKYYYLNFLENLSSSYLEINFLETSEIKRFLKLSYSSSIPVSQWGFSLHPLIEVVKLTVEEKKQVTTLINEFSKLKVNYSSASEPEIVLFDLYIYCLKLFLHAPLTLKKESEAIIEQITLLQNQYDCNAIPSHRHLIPQMSVCVLLWTASHHLFYKNFSQSIIYYDKFLELIENPSILTAFQGNILLLEAKALAMVNRDITLKLVKITNEISAEFKQDFNSNQEEKTVSIVDSDHSSIPKTNKKKKNKNKKNRKKIDRTIEDKSINAPIPARHDPIQERIDNITIAHDQMLKQVGIEINAPVGENPALVVYCKKSTSIDNMIFAYAGEYPSPMPSLMPAVNSADIIPAPEFPEFIPSMEYNPPIEYNKYSLVDQLPVDSSLHSFKLDNQSSLIPVYVNPVQLLRDSQYVDYICLTYPEITRFLLLLPTQIKVRKINELAFNTQLETTIISELIHFLDKQRIEVDKLNLNNTGLSNHEIAVLASLTSSCNINRITYLDLSGNRLINNSELQVSLRKILENCPLLINVCIDSESVPDNIFDLRTQLTKNADAFSQTVKYLIVNNQAEQLKSLFQDSLVLKSLDSFMGEFYDYAINTNSLLCLNVLLNISTIQHHPRPISWLEEKIQEHKTKLSNHEITASPAPTSSDDLSGNHQPLLSRTLEQVILLRRPVAEVKENKYATEQKINIQELESKIEKGLTHFQSAIQNAIRQRMKAHHITRKPDNFFPYEFLKSALKFRSIIKIHSGCTIYGVGGLIVNLFEPPDIAEQEFNPFDMDFIATINDVTLINIAKEKGWPHEINRFLEITTFKFYFEGINIDIVCWPNFDPLVDRDSRDVNINSVYLDMDEKEGYPYLIADESLVFSLIDAQLLGVKQPGFIKACPGYFKDVPIGEIIPQWKRLRQGVETVDLLALEHTLKNLTADPIRALRLAMMLRKRLIQFNHFDPALQACFINPQQNPFLPEIIKNHVREKKIYFSFLFDKNLKYVIKKAAQSLDRTAATSNKSYYQKLLKISSRMMPWCFQDPSFLHIFTLPLKIRVTKPRYPENIDIACQRLFAEESSQTPVYALLLKDLIKLHISVDNQKLSTRLMPWVLALVLTINGKVLGEGNLKVDVLMKDIAAVVQHIPALNQLYSGGRSRSSIRGYLTRFVIALKRDASLLRMEKKENSVLPLESKIIVSTNSSSLLGQHSDKRSSFRTSLVYRPIVPCPLIT